MKKLFLLFIGALLTQLLSAQEIKPNRTSINYFYDAEAFMYENNHNAALDLLLKLEEIDPENPNIWYKIGFCYLNTRLYKTKAQSYLERAVKFTSPNYKPDNHRETNAPLETYLYLAIAYRMNYEFENSLQSLKDLRIKLNPGDAKDKLLLSLISREEEITNNAIYYYNNPVDAQLRNLGPTINSEFADHSPIIDLNENYLIFTSKRPRDGQGIENQDEDIFISKNQNSTWQEPIRLGTPVNTLENNEAAIGISIDGKQMFFFKSGMHNTGSIFVTESEDVYNWSVPKLLRDDVNTKYRETHATITPDGNSIFFTSNRKGGVGGSDIYVMRKLPDNKWSNPQILPNEVNTEYDEESPYVHPDGVTLFFSSKGHSTMGGYDVFSTTMSKDGKYTEPVNLGYPINTPDDDVSYVMNMDGRRGYIATVKDDSFGDLDLYEILQAGVYENNLIVYDGIVSDINSNIPEDLIIAVREANTGNYIGIYRPNKKDGRYLLVLLPDNSYEISYEASGYLLHSIIQNPTKNDVKTFTTNYLPIELDPVLLQAFLMHDFVYFDEGEVKLDDEGTKTLDKVIAKDIEWEANAAQMIVNLNLPVVGANPIRDKARADAIKDYLTLKGIDSSNIYLNGSYPQGYKDVYGLDLRERQKQIAINQLPTGDSVKTDKITIQINNILFDFDRYDIIAQYHANLEILAAYMNDNPNAQIEIGGHTDWLGSNEYNYLLSYRRSKSVKDYLVAKGNNPENIITVKYGEDKPIASNQTSDGRDNPSGRKYNRRAEFKVLSQGSVNFLSVNKLIIEGEDLAGNPNNLENKTSNTDHSKKFTIQIMALKNQKPVDFFSDMVGVKMKVSDDGWHRYYVGEFDSYKEAKAALDNLKSMGYNPFIRKLSFFQK